MQFPVKSVVDHLHPVLGLISTSSHTVPYSYALNSSQVKPSETSPKCSPNVPTNSLTYVVAVFSNLIYKINFT